MGSLTLGSLEMIGGTFTALFETTVGDWVPITTSTSSLFLDGAVVSGDASANREIELVVLVEADTRPELIAACELLVGEANKQSNTLQYTPDGGVTVVYDTFRATVTQTDDRHEPTLMRTYNLVLPALPFARSNVRRTPTASFPPGTGGAVELIDVDYTGITGTTSVYDPAYGDADPSARSYLRGIPASTSGAYVVNNAPGLVLGGMGAVSNCSITSTSNQRNVVATAAGVATAKSVTPLALSADAVTVGLSFDAANSVNVAVTVGVEWFNGGTSLRTDWGTPTFQADDRPAWASAARPATATHFGFRVRATAASAGQLLRVSWVSAQLLTFVSSPLASVNPINRTPYGPPVASAAYWKFSASKDVSTQTHVQVLLYRSSEYMATIAGSNLTVRIHSSDGKSSGWYYRPDVTENAAFPDKSLRRKFFPLVSPDIVSDSGAATLTDIVAISFDGLGNSGAGATYTGVAPAFAVRSAMVGLGEGIAPPSTRGVVYVLDEILGSARSPAAVHAFSTTALTDVVIQAVDPLDGPALIVPLSDVATAVAPANYQGVYSIVGTRSPASTVATPTMVVTQKHAGTTVASVTLDGVMRPGNHYVDFGTTPLPLVAVPDENISVSFTFALAPSGSWGEVLVLNVNSPLMMLEQVDPPRKHVWIDEPAIVTGIGKVFVATTDRTDAAAPPQPPALSLPFTVKAPATSLLIYSTAAGPSVSLSYIDHWNVEPGGV